MRMCCRVRHLSGAHFNPAISCTHYLICMHVYAGAHFNPAISFTHYLNGDLTVRQLTRYALARSARLYPLL